MDTQQLIDYVRQQLAAGVTKDSIKSALMKSGWTEQDVNEAFVTVSELRVPSVAKPSEATGTVVETKSEIMPVQKSKWPTIIAIIVTLAAVVAVAYYAFQIYVSKTIISITSITNTVPSASIQTNTETTISTTSLQTNINASSTSTSIWKTYTNTQYGFSVMYPPTGWLLTDGATDGVLSYANVKPLTIENLVTRRGGNQEVYETLTTISIAVYQKPMNLSVYDWLSSYMPDLPKTKTGGITTALQEANAQAMGLLTYKESENGTVEISEFGGVALAEYFIYATYLHNLDSPYVYDVELSLPLRYNTATSTDPDSTYENVYNQILSSFKFTK